MKPDGPNTKIFKTENILKSNLINKYDSYKRGDPLSLVDDKWKMRKENAAKKRGCGKAAKEKMSKGTVREFSTLFYSS